MLCTRLALVIGAGNLDFIVLDLDRDVGVKGLLELALGALDGEDIVFLFNSYASGDGDVQFTNS